jgi:membrane-associated protease RseP (regulator of RpoE activity)
MALASLVTSLLGLFLFPPLLIVGIALGKRSLREEGPSSLARAGVIIGWVGLVLWAVGICLVAALFGLGLVGALAGRGDTPALPDVGPTGEPGLAPMEPLEGPLPAESAPPTGGRSGWKLGITCEDRGGARVAEVVPGSAAERIGLQPGDGILSVNSHGIVDCDDLRDTISSLRTGETVTLKIWRNGETFAVDVTVGE